MKIEMYDIDVKNKNWTLLQQVHKVWEEIREVEIAIVNKDIPNFFEECNDVKQSIHTLELLAIKLLSLNSGEIERANELHIAKMLEKYEKKD